MKFISAFLLFFLAFQIHVNSQIAFEQGYIKDDSDSLISCLIKNKDWLNNPTEIEYKLTEDSEVKYSDINMIKEFSVRDVSHYVRATVEIDRSSNITGKLSEIREPVFNEEMLFLKVLIEGKANLYYYREGNIIRYFYKTDSTEIKQLVYKKFVIKPGDVAGNNSISASSHQGSKGNSDFYAGERISENNDYQKQLYIHLSCPDISLNDVLRANYDYNDLTDLFIKYNRSAGVDFIDLSRKKSRNPWNLTVSPGVNMNTFGMYSAVSNLGSITWDPAYSVRAGIELEYILPFNKDKWSWLIEPTIHYYKAEDTSESPYVSGGILVSKIVYNSIELPVGFRYRLYLNSDAVIFFDAYILFDFSYNSHLELFRSDGSLYKEYKIVSSTDQAIGVGYRYKDRISLEFRYNAPRHLLGTYANWDSEYRTYSLILGIGIF